MPHKSALTNWTSSINAEPGFSKEVFAKLEKLDLADRDCNLVLDAMAIRKQIIWDAKVQKFIGYCNFGDNLMLDSDETPATEALVFMLVSLNGKWKSPIGYFLQNKCSSSILAELIKSALILSSDAGLKVWGVTCDGTTTNFSAFNLLGCNIYNSFQCLKSSFKHPNKDEVLNFIPDACHMLKLARNALGTYKHFKSDKGLIEWRFIEDLNKLQENIGLKLGNKLTNTHVDFHKNIMKVKISFY